MCIGNAPLITGPFFVFTFLSYGAFAQSLPQSMIQGWMGSFDSTSLPVSVIKSGRISLDTAGRAEYNTASLLVKMGQD